MAYVAELGSLAIGSFLGAMLGAGSKLLEQWLEHRRRRRALATALLVELHSLDSGLRQLVELNKPSRSEVQVASRFFHKARAGELADMLLFKSQTVYEVMKFGGLVNKLLEVIEAARNASPAGERDEYNIKMRALFGLRVVGTLKHSLISEGGVVPRLPPSNWYKYPELPPMPPDAFPIEDGNTFQVPAPDA